MGQHVKIRATRSVGRIFGKGESKRDGRQPGLLIHNQRRNTHSTSDVHTPPLIVLSTVRCSWANAESTVWDPLSVCLYCSSLHNTTHFIHASPPRRHLSINRPRQTKSGLRSVSTLLEHLGRQHRPRPLVRACTTHSRSTRDSSNRSLFCKGEGACSFCHPPTTQQKRCGVSGQHTAVGGLQVASKTNGNQQTPPPTYHHYHLGYAMMQHD